MNIDLERPIDAALLVSLLFAAVTLVALVGILLDLVEIIRTKEPSLAPATWIILPALCTILAGCYIETRRELAMVGAQAVTVRAWLIIIGVGGVVAAAIQVAAGELALPSYGRRR